MTRPLNLNVQVKILATHEDREILRAAAKKRNVSMGQVFRELIASLQESDRAESAN